MPNESVADPTPRPRVRFSDALRFWIKLGFISFGGPAGQIAILHREVVERRGWISEARFLHALNYCMLLPGPEAQQLTTYIGWLLHRTRGALVAGILFVLPSAFILIGLSYVYAQYGEVPAVAGVLSGIKGVVVALVAEAVLRIGRRALRRAAHYVIAACAFVAIYFLNVPFPVIVGAAVLVGLALTQWWTRGSTPGPGAASSAVDDDAPAPDHTVPSVRRGCASSPPASCYGPCPASLLPRGSGGTARPRNSIVSSPAPRS